MIRQNLSDHLTQLLQNEFDVGGIDQFFPVSGGSINETYGIKTDKEQFFIKINAKSSYPEMFQKEKQGLELLMNKSSLSIPKPLFVGDFENHSFLIMEFVESASPRVNFWEEFGRGLAGLHQNSNSHFGLDHDNYIGSLPQKNEYATNWVDFFIESRLKVQEKLAVDNQLIDTNMSKMLAVLYKKLHNLLPIEEPSLLHGDLWSGNFMVDSGGYPTIVDPAVYYGHREVDLAMSLLFGGFQKRFYESYHEVFPLEKNWEERVEILNLYPLLVHVNLFGTSYSMRVKSVLRKLV